MRKNIMLCICLFLCVGCSSMSSYSHQDKIISFYYKFGSYSSGYYEYRIDVLDGKNFFVAKGYNGIDLYVSVEVDDSFLSDLSNIIVNNDIKKWNGFDKSDTYTVMNGYSFNLFVKYDDGQTISAYGYVERPENYDIAHEVLFDYLKTVK